MSLPKGEWEPDTVGFVLAGGQSSRMGADKALIQLSGRPLVVRALDTLRQAGLTASIAGARSSLADFAPVVEDSSFLIGLGASFGPLSGICAALAAASAQRAVFLPVDLPLLPTSLIAFLVERARNTDAVVTLPSVNGFTQTFPAVIDRTVLPALEARLRSGDFGCYSAFQAAAAGSGRPTSVIPVEFLVQSGHLVHPSGLPPALWFLNVNSPDDLARAEILVSGRFRVS